MRRAARRLGAALAASGLVAVGLVAGSLLPAGGASRRAGGTSVVATVHGARIAAYRRPGARRPARTLRRATPPGTPFVLLVRARRHGWLRVLLPVRPNHASGWIHARAATLRTDPYRLVVALGAHRLVLRRGVRVLMREPIGVGRAATPTPPGLAYVTELLRQPDPHGLYGPWAFGLSVYSPVLASFGGGPGQVGIHGTDAPAGIGHDVSHGCIRLRNAAIVRLARLLPLGTPVQILR